MMKFNPKRISEILLPLYTEESNPSSNGNQTASVFVPLIMTETGWHILYTKRTETLMHHRGQISFPGGMAEEDDRNAMATALRETEEELGVDSSTIQLLGRMQNFVTIHKMVIHPFVGILAWPQKVNFSKDEVSKVFSIPVQWLMNPENYVEREYNGHPDVVFYDPYDGEILWGITARITKDFLDMVME